VKAKGPESRVRTVREAGMPVADEVDNVRLVRMFACYVCEVVNRGVRCPG
jgi:hypothetical protein